MADPEVVEGLRCERRLSGFKFRQPPFFTKENMKDIFVCRYRSPSPEQRAEAEKQCQEWDDELLINPISEQERQEIKERLKKAFKLGE